MTQLLPTTGNRPFLGVVGDESFKMRLNYSGKTSFFPIISGSIRLGKTGTSVSGIMYLHPFVAIFMFCLLGTLAYSALFTEGTSAPALWIIFVLVLALPTPFFFIQSIRAKELINHAVNRSTYDVANMGRIVSPD
jgi:hypothetical protein